MQVTDYFYDQINGFDRKYHPNGQIAYELQYRMGESRGEAVRWDSDGNLLR